MMNGTMEKDFAREMQRMGSETQVRMNKILLGVDEEGAQQLYIAPNESSEYHNYAQLRCMHGCKMWIVHPNSMQQLTNYRLHSKEYTIG